MFIHTVMLVLLLVLVCLVPFSSYLPTPSAASSGSGTMATADLATTLQELDQSRDQRTRNIASPMTFLTSCLQHELIPKGMLVQFGKKRSPQFGFSSPGSRRHHPLC